MILAVRIKRIYQICAKSRGAGLFLTQPRFFLLKVPAEPVLQLREDLLCRFDIFLRAAEKEARGG
jgi:hypothetical protein